MDREPPPMQLPVLDPRDIEKAKRDPNHPMYWWYGEWAGGWKLDFGMYEGELIREVPYYDYLKFCKSHSRADRSSFHYAMDKYEDGLMDQVGERSGDFCIPFSGEYFGRCIKECRTEYLNWLLGRKSKRADEKKYELFYVAVQDFLNKISLPGPAVFDFEGGRPPPKQHNPRSQYRYPPTQPDRAIRNGDIESVTGPPLNRSIKERLSRFFHGLMGYAR